MPTQGLPNFPSKKSIERKQRLYTQRYAEHERGEHTERMSYCKLCRIEADAKKGKR